MVKVNKNLKKKQVEEEALKKKLLQSMKLSIHEEEESEDEEAEDEEGLEVEGSGSEAEENDDEEGDEDSDEEDEGVVALDKSVYEESDDDDDDEEGDDDDEQEEDDDDEEEVEVPVKSGKKSKEPAAKRPKLEKAEESEEEEEDDDDDDEVTEEPIKRVAEVENKALKRKLEKAQKKNQTEAEKSNFENIKVEELPLTCFLTNVPHNLGKNGIVEALKPFTGFQRIFFQGARGSNQQFKFFVVFENKEQMDKAIETEISFKNPKNPKLTGKAIKLIPTKWTIFNSLGGHCVCVKGLTQNISETDLKRKFEGFGEVLKIELVTKTKGSDLKFPFAYIFYKEVESASKVVETGTLEIKNVKVDVHAFQTNNKEVVNENGVHLEKNQGPPVALNECSRTLHVSNAHQFATNQEIVELMSKFGEVNRVLSQINKSQNNKKADKFFKVVFENSEGYSNALKAKKLILGKKNLHKSPIKWNTLAELQPHMVKVDGLPADVTKENLVKIFEIFGTIANIDIVKPKKRENTIAFVFYESKLSAKKAVSLDGTQYEGQTLSVHQRRTQNKGADSAVFIKKPDSKDVTAAAIEKELQKIGPIKKVHDGKKNFVVTFRKSDDATKALNLKEVKVAGETLELVRHQLTNQNSAAVLVTGLAKGTKIEQVVKHFKSCGKVLKKYIGSSKRASGARTTFAYLEFGKQEEKTKALKLSKTSLNGKLIFVANSKPRV